MPIQLWLVLTTMWLSAACRYNVPLCYNPAGRVLLIENARAAVKRGVPVVGVAAKDGLALVTKSSSKSKLKGRHKFEFVDEHLCIASCGLAADTLAVSNVAKALCSKYKKEFGCNIPIENLASDLAQWAHDQTRRAGTRPMGVAVLIAGFDEVAGGQIFSVDPQGACYRWSAHCIGADDAPLVRAFASCNNDPRSLPLSDALKRLAEQDDFLGRKPTENKGHNTFLVLRCHRGEGGKTLVTTCMEESIESLRKYGSPL